MFKQIRNNLLVLSALFLALGVCLLVYPVQSQNLLCYLIGGGILLYGVWGLLDYLGHRPTGILAQISLGLSLVCAALGLFLLLQPAIVVSVLPFVFGVFITMDGLARIPTAMQLRRAGFARWWSYLLLAAISVGLGVYMICRPFATAVALFRILGALLIVEGAMNLASTLYACAQLRTLQKVLDEAESAPGLEIEGEARDVTDTEENGGPSGSAF